MKSPFVLPGLPFNASAQGADVDSLLTWVHILMFALFVGWISYFIYVLFRFHKSRHPTSIYKGAATHASTYVEGIIVLIEASLLIGLALPVWARTVEHFPPQKGATIMKIIGQQFQWNAWYASTNGDFVAADPKKATGDNTFGFDKKDPHFKDNFVIGRSDFLVPVGKPVIAYISSLDVIHSFACRPMRAMQDAIPGMSIPLHFTPAVTGTYMINCAQLCGAGHYSMKGTLKVVAQEDYDKWVAGKIKANAATGGGGGYE